MLNLKILTLYPEVFPGVLKASVIGKALDEKKWTFEAVNIRDFAEDKYKTVDDVPFGGGAGMLMKPDVLDRAISKEAKGRIIYLSPKGAPLTQKKVRELSKEENLTILCGRFEGIDDRIFELYPVEEISIGDFVLAGGEVAAMALIEAMVRVLPGVLGNEESIASESFEEDGLLEYPQYTRPAEFKGLAVPEVLRSGNHAEIKKWQAAKALELTQARRPELLTKKGNDEHVKK